MDTITQAALGAAVGQAGFSKQLGRHAVWVGALMGALPDLDVASALLGPWASMVHHRVGHMAGWAALVVTTGYLALGYGQSQQTCVWRPPSWRLRDSIR